jgi:hypothetical protein
MISRIILIIFIIAGIFPGHHLQAQQYFLTGTDLCSNGSQSTNIGLTDSDPAKMYAIYRDDQLLAVRTINTAKSPNPLDFGQFSEPGKYTVVEFTEGNPDYKHPEKGRSISGTISINSIPVLDVPEKMEIKSGDPYKYQPHANINGCRFKWTTRLESGKAGGYIKSGEGMIADKVVLTGNKPVCIIYLITPFSPANLGSCMGNTTELTVWIRQ